MFDSSSYRLAFSRRPRVAAFLVCLCAAVSAASVIGYSELHRIEVERTRVAALAEHAHEFQYNIERALSATYFLAALVRQGNGSISNFDAVANQMLPYYPGVSALQLAPGGVIQRSAPLAGNEKAIGHNMLKDPAGPKEELPAGDTGKLTLGGPFDLVQGGLAAVGRLPVFLANAQGKPSFWGYATAVIKFPDVLNGVQLQNLVAQGFGYELWRIHSETGRKQIIASSSLVPLVEPVEKKLEILNATWTLSMAPIRGWGDPLGLSLKIGLGLLFSLLLAFLAKLLVELKVRQQELEVRIAERTREIYATQRQLQATLEAVPDTLFDLGLDGRYHDCHSPRADPLAAPAADMIGKKVTDVLPRDAADVVMSALREAHENAQSHGRQFELQLPQGKLWFELSVSRKFTDPGQEPRFIVLSREITERKQGEQQLRVAATAFESQEGMVVTDAETVILRVNRAFTDITGYSAEEVVGQTSNLLRSGHHDAASFAAMWESIHRTDLWQGEIWNRRKNGEVYLGWLSVTAVKGGDGEVTHYVGTLTDITQRKAAEEEIMHLAFYDPLTRLPNRRLLLDRLKQALAASVRSKREGALLLIDLDNFKTINDTLGHDMGDMLLQQVAQRLATCSREEDTVARLGGDEFVVMLVDLSEVSQEAATQVKTVGEKIVATLGQPYLLSGYEHHSTASIGVTLFGDRQLTSDELLKRADLAMYQAKSAGRNTLRFFDPDMQAVVTARAAMEADMRQGLRQNDFLLYYQAQVDCAGRLTGAEALVRWQHPQRGLVCPAEFIPLAEETGLILPLGQWVLETACNQLVAWAARPNMAHLTVAVNVSVRQFRDAGFVDQVVAVLDHTGANPKKLKLELTESLLVEDVEDTIAKMFALKAEGVSFSLDDFGTGYSSLAYLKRLPLDQLKIDQSFVRNILTDRNDATIAHTIVTLAQSLGLAVIAEGVETEAQRDFLAGHGCDAYQGYFFGRPTPVEALEQFPNLD